MMDLVDIHSTSSKDEFEDENVIVNGERHYNTINSKEGRLKTIPQDVTYASHFAGKSSTEVYDRICTVNHFGHIANRILRKLIASENLPVICGNTLGKNRKTRADQRQHFENLSESGVVFLHTVIKQGMIPNVLEWFHVTICLTQNWRRKQSLKHLLFFLHNCSNSYNCSNNNFTNNFHKRAYH